jgi:uncharacterized membrane protein
MNRPVSLMLLIATAVMPAACGTGHDGAAPSASSAPSAAAPASKPPPRDAAGTVAVTTAPPILASGTNPDWSILIGAGIVMVKSFDGSQRVFPAVKSVSAGSSANFSMGSGARHAALKLDPGPCAQDAQSMTARVDIDGRTATGCARHQEAATADAADWSDTLFDFVPALRACLARAQVEGASANHVAAQPDGTLVITVQDADGSRFNCTASPMGSSVRGFEAAPADEPVADPVPAFSRAAAAFARMGCDEAPAEVVSNAGEMLGYVQRGHCNSPGVVSTP